MTSETDAEFVERMFNEWGEWAGSPANARLFALARRGAEAADRIEQLEAALRHYSCTCANEFDGCKARYDMTVCCGWTARAALGEERM